MSTLTKADIIEALQHGNSGATRSQNTMILENLLLLMKKAIVEDGSLLISGFGKWETYRKSPRKGRNPATGNHIILDGHRVCAFRLSRRLKMELNGKTIKDQG